MSETTRHTERDGEYASVLRRPDLWAEAVRMVWRYIPKRVWWGWRPWPSRDFLRFRMTTYGADRLRDMPMVPYLEWCRDFRKALRPTVDLPDIDGHDLADEPCPSCGRLPDEHNAAQAYRCLEAVAVAAEERRASGSRTTG